MHIISYPHNYPISIRQVTQCSYLSITLIISDRLNNSICRRFGKENLQCRKYQFKITVRSHPAKPLSSTPNSQSSINVKTHTVHNNRPVQLVQS